MGIITAEISAETQEWVWIGHSWPGRAFWVPRAENNISYSWAYRNDWMVPPWLSKPTEIGDSFQSDELPSSVFETGQPVSYSTKSPGNIEAIKNLIPSTDIDHFEKSGFSSTQSSITENSREIIGAKHRDEWYSYAGLYLLYTTWVQPFVKMTTTRHYIRFRKNTCPNKDSLPEGVIVLREDCGMPLPPNLSPSGGGSNFQWVQFQKKPKKRTKIEKNGRWEEMAGCCSCAAIADMIAQQSVQIKEMFDAQNLQIGETLTDQTKFLQEQMIAGIPDGFDYEPIFDKIDDGVNRIWNGLNI
jgi:hypothetical protein